MSDLALYEATRDVWKVAPPREKARYALSIYRGVVQEAYEILDWDRACTTAYTTRTFKDKTVPSRWEFVGRVAAPAVRERDVGKSVRSHLTPGSRSPIIYVGVPR